MKELTLREIQNESLKVLADFHDVCEEHNFTYYLAYGTLIGAIRHKGYIPWDDDVDVWMPREDYEKFIALCAENGDSIKGYKLCNRINTKNYTFGIPRLCNMDYKYITTQKNMKDIDIGVFIDIYPLDNYTNDPVKAKSLMELISRTNTKYSVYVNGKSYSESNVLKSLAKQLYHVLLRIRYGKDYRFKIDDEIKNIIKENTSDDDLYCGMYAWETNFFLMFEKEKLKERILVDFEDKKLWVPKNYDYVLRSYYGDYMQLPPEDKREPHHFYKIVKR